MRRSVRSPSETCPARRGLSNEALPYAAVLHLVSRSPLQTQLHGPIICYLSFEALQRRAHMHIQALWTQDDLAVHKKLMFCFKWVRSCGHSFLLYWFVLEQTSSPPTPPPPPLLIGLCYESTWSLAWLPKFSYDVLMPEDYCGTSDT